MIDDRISRLMDLRFFVPASRVARSNFGQTGLLRSSLTGKLYSAILLKRYQLSVGWPRRPLGNSHPDHRFGSLSADDLIDSVHLIVFTDFAGRKN